MASVQSIESLSSSTFLVSVTTHHTIQAHFGRTTVPSAPLTPLPEQLLDRRFLPAALAVGGELSLLQGLAPHAPYARLGSVVYVSHSPVSLLGFFLCTSSWSVRTVKHVDCANPHLLCSPPPSLTCPRADARASLVGAFVYFGAAIAWFALFLTKRAEWGATADAISLIIPKGY